MATKRRKKAVDGEAAADSNGRQVTLAIGFNQAMIDNIDAEIARIQDTAGISIPITRQSCVKGIVDTFFASKE